MIAESQVWDSILPVGSDKLMINCTMIEFELSLGLWREDMSTLDDLFRCSVYDFQNLASELDTQVSGLVIVFDFHDFTMDKMRNLTPSRLKVVADLVQVPFVVQFGHIFLPKNWKF